MKSPLERVRLGATVLGVVIVIAVAGYVAFDGRSLVDATYFVVITLAGVGFGEKSEFTPPLQLFTIAIILVGMTAFGYTLGGLVQFMTEGELERVLGQQRTTRGIENLKDHVILCGYGRIGQILSHDLVHFKQTFVVIDQDPQQLVETREREYLCVLGDATQEHVLQAAGVERAKSLVTALPSDAANVFITLTARNLNPAIQIIARAEHRSSEKKLKQAGANRVVLPASIGARRMARMITHPSTADVIEQVAESSHLDVELDEATILPGSRLVGMSLQESEAKRRFNLLVVAIRRADGSLLFNPDIAYVFQSHDVVVVMGRNDEVQRFRKEYSL